MQTQEHTQRIALAQIASRPEETQAARLNRVANMLRAKQHELTSKGEKQVQLFVLPELWSSGYFCFADFATAAESVNPQNPALSGPTVQFGHRLAQEMRCWLHIGSVLEAHSNGAVTNTALLFNPAGEIVQLYRKIHVFGYQSEEKQLLTPGTLLPVLTTPFGDIASTTCYDLRFPGLWQEISNRGVSMVITPAAWPLARLQHWQTLVRARAVEHQSWILACNSCETQTVTSTRNSTVSTITLAGHSMIVSPVGDVIASAGEQEEIIVADIDPALPAKIRTSFPVYADRLPTATYTALDSTPTNSQYSAHRIRVSAVVMRDPAGKILNVRKKGTEKYMLPGGKPELGEDALATAVREFREELGVQLDPSKMQFLGVFTAPAANEPGHTVEAAVFQHPYVPEAAEAASKAEIAELFWCDPALPNPAMAPLNTDVIFPALLS